MGNALHARKPEPVFVEARIKHLDGGIGIALARLPAAERGTAETHGRHGCARAGQHVSLGDRHVMSLPRMFSVSR
jgi:hypothetical protein